jgi:hypothetical protein
MFIEIYATKMLLVRLIYRTSGAMTLFGEFIEAGDNG